MYNYSIIPIFRNRISETVEDIRNQYRSSVADLALLKMTLTPEGNPPIDKASILCETYDAIRDGLAETDDKCGVLVQATIGHGYRLDRDNDFTKFTQMSDGKKINVVCPFDDDFCDYIRKQFHTIAEHKPSLIMVDDDFRLLQRGGCGCQLHIDAFEKLTGLSYTREELYQHIWSGKPEDKPVREAYIETHRQSLLKAARAMREGIDEVDPSIPGAYCTCGNTAEFSDEIAGILAGKGNPVIVRVNNGRYTVEGARYLSSNMKRAAMQIAVTKKADVFLAETDTCPQNRYSTGAYTVHAQFIASILEGCSGAKHWITRMSTYEPKSGAAYRKILSKYAGLYRTLSDTVNKTVWEGCCIPIPSKPRFFGGDGNESWSSCVLERLGLPMYFACTPNENSVLFADGGVSGIYSDEEWKERFRGTVVLSGEETSLLNKRGFIDMTGTEAVKWQGENISGELDACSGSKMGSQMGIHCLTPVSSEIKAESECYHLDDGKHIRNLFPGCVVYKNPLGGTTVIFAGTPRARFNYQEAFSFLNETRKAQFIRILTQTGNLPLWYDGDEEILARCGKITGTDERLAIFINIGLDPIEQVCIGMNIPFSSVERLMPDGNYSKVDFTRTENGFSFDMFVVPQDAIILKIH